MYLHRPSPLRSLANNNNNNNNNNSNNNRVRVAYLSPKFSAPAPVSVPAATRYPTRLVVYTHGCLQTPFFVFLLRLLLVVYEPNFFTRRLAPKKSVLGSPSFRHVCVLINRCQRVTITFRRFIKFIQLFSK